MSIPRVEYEQRIERVRAAMRPAGADALLLTSPENIYYLSGYQSLGYFSLQALVVPQRGAATLIIRELELANAAASSIHDQIVGYRDQDDPVALMAAQARSHKVVAVERQSRSLSAAVLERLTNALAAATVADASGIVERLRLRKSAVELECIRRAGRIARQGMAAALDRVGPGRAERDAASAAYAALLSAGSEWTGAPPFVASGPRSSHGHATWTDRAFEAGDPVFLEVNAAIARYHAAQMRSACIAPVPATHGAMVSACRAGVEAAIAKARPGVPAREVDRACRKVIEDAGFARYFRLRSGYSVGIGFENFGEGSIFSLHQGNASPLEEGMALHVLVYLSDPGVAGCAFSETVIVQPDGAEIVTCGGSDGH